MIFYGVEFLASFVEVYIAYGLLERLFSGEKNKKLIAQRLVLSILLTGMIWGINRIKLFSYFTLLITVAWVSLTALKFYKIKIQYSILVVSFYVLCIYVIDFLCLSMMGFVIDDKQFALKMVNGIGLERSIFIFLAKLLLIAAYFIFKKYVHYKNRYLETKFLLGITITGYLGVFFLVKQTMESLNKNIAAYWLFFAAIILLIFFGMYFYTEIKSKTELIQIIQIRSDLMENDYELVRNAYETNAKLFHDLNNHINTIHQLLITCDYDEAIKYIEELKEPLNTLKTAVWSGNKVVDFILNSKKDQAEKMGIRFEINAEYPSHADIQSKDLVSILGNLLDNAIEACSQGSAQQDKWIKIILRNINNMLIIKIQNSLFNELHIENKSLKTTKNDTKLHGWGVKSVESTAEKYEGTVQYSFTESDFTIVVVLHYDKLDDCTSSQKNIF